MNFIYVLLPEINPGWDDMRIYLDEQKAIEASILLPEYRVEIFEIDSVDGSFIPSLNYYKCGILITPYN